MKNITVHGDINKTPAKGLELNKKVLQILTSSLGNRGMETAQKKKKMACDRYKPHGLNLLQQKRKTKIALKGKQH